MRLTLNGISLWVKVIKQMQLLSVMQITEIELLSPNKKTLFFH